MSSQTSQQPTSEQAVSQSRAIVRDLMSERRSVTLDGGKVKVGYCPKHRYPEINDKCRMCEFQAQREAAERAAADDALISVSADNKILLLVPVAARESVQERVNKFLESPAGTFLMVMSIITGVLLAVLISIAAG